MVTRPADHHQFMCRKCEVDRSAGASMRRCWWTHRAVLSCGVDSSRLVSRSAGAMSAVEPKEPLERPVDSYTDRQLLTHSGPSKSWRRLQSQFLPRIEVVDDETFTRKLGEGRSKYSVVCSIPQWNDGREIREDAFGWYFPPVL